MKRLVLPLVILFLPTLICQAETEPVAEITLPPIVIAKPNPSSAEIPYGFSKLTLNSGPVKEVKIDHPQSAGNSFSLVGTAEAFIDSDEHTIAHFERICNAINNASRLEDLKPLITENNFQSLQAQVNEGASPYAVVGVIRSMRPRDIHIIDSVIDKDQATLAVTGRSHFGLTNGLIHLVKSDGLWKIENEEWYAADDHYLPIYNPLTLANKTPAPVKSALMTELGPDHIFNKNRLSLTKTGYKKEKKAFTFVFFMNKGKTGPKTSELTFEGQTTSKKNLRPRMHIMWTASKKILKEQQLIEDQYPMDVSIANYDDGFASDEWNLILPRNKPREIIFSWMWNF
jgi:hypothetical protein